MSISDQIIRKVISEYTQEAGLRNLERSLGAICRKVARRIAEDEKGPFRITGGTLQRYLGVPEYLPEPGREEGEVGVATGWPGPRPAVKCCTWKFPPCRQGQPDHDRPTGRRDEESAQAALSLIAPGPKSWTWRRSSTRTWTSTVHVPAGAIPRTARRPA